MGKSNTRQNQAMLFKMVSTCKTQKQPQKIIMTTMMEVYKFKHLREGGD